MALNQYYDSLVGKTFEGSYLKEWTRGDHEAQIYHVIDVLDASSKLESILDKIHTLGNGRVWKGFIGPEDSGYLENYRFYALLEDEDDIDGEGTFKITDVREFRFTEKMWKEKQNYSERRGFNIFLKLI